MKNWYDVEIINTLNKGTWYNIRGNMGFRSESITGIRRNTSLA